MPDVYIWVIHLINQSEEIGEKQLSVFGSRGDQISPLIHVYAYVCTRTYTSVHFLNSISNLYKLHRHAVFVIIFHCTFICYFELCTLLIGGNKELLLSLLLLL